MIPDLGVAQPGSRCRSDALQRTPEGSRCRSDALQRTPEGSACSMDALQGSPEGHAEQARRVALQELAKAQANNKERLFVFKPRPQADSGS